MIQLNYRDSKPIYEQIKDGFRKLIITNSLSANEKLPSVRELASGLAINPNTIQKAYRDLESEGYTYTVAGKGTFVAEHREILNTRQHELLEEFDEVVEELCFLSVSRRSDHTDRTCGRGRREGMIQVNGLKKAFDGFVALNGVDMHVEKGAIYGLVGPNGAGKSTLIRHLTGVYSPDQGEVQIDGENVYENKAVKSKIAYIPDELFYFMQADTMEMKRFYEGIYPSFDGKLFYRMQEFFPNIDVKRNIRRLSKGMQKQVAFWLAICCKPDILSLDEPVDGLDPVMRRQIWSIILSEVAEKEMTVLVSSHNLRELEDVCDHVGIMHHGKIMIERSLSDLQGSVSKIQVACQSGMPKLPEHFQVLHMANTGRVYTMIVKGDPKEAEAALSYCNPTIVDVLPLTLEEIFIYEMGGADYEVKDILF